MFEGNEGGGGGMALVFLLPFLLRKTHKDVSYCHLRRADCVQTTDYGVLEYSLLEHPILVQMVMFVN